MGGKYRVYKKPTQLISAVLAALHSIPDAVSKECKIIHTLPTSDECPSNYKLSRFPSIELLRPLYKYMELSSHTKLEHVQSCFWDIVRCSKSFQCWFQCMKVPSLGLNYEVNLIAEFRIYLFREKLTLLLVAHTVGCSESQFNILKQEHGFGWWALHSLRFIQ